MHYQRWWTGQNHRPVPSAEQRLWTHTDKSGNCWIWTGRRERFGHGRISVAGREEYAHRLAWMLTNGPIPGGMAVCHTCDNPPCVRPDHLFLGTRRINNADRAAKGRNGYSDRRGERGGNAKLTDEAVRTMRSAYRNGALQKDLATEYGVDPSLVSLIVRNRIWTHVN